MTIRVNIEGIGPATFPDGTADDVIDKAVKGLVAEKAAEKQAKYSDLPFGQFTKIWDIANQEAQAGGKAVNKAVEDPTGGNIINGVLGALQWGASPITAIGKGVFGDPAEIVSRSLGAPEGVTKVVRGMAESADILLPYGAAVKTAVATKKTLDAAKAAEAASKAMKLGDDIKRIISAKTTGKPLEFPEQVPEGLIQEVQQRISGGTQKKIMAEEFTNELIDAVKDKVGPKWNPAERRITQEVANYFVGEPQEMSRFLKNHPDYTPEKLAAELIETMSTSGRELSIMGRWAKELKSKYSSPEMQKIAKFMEKELPETSTMDNVMNIFKSIENTRRGMLVGQVATSARNAISQGGRLTIGVVDDAFQGAIKGFMGSAGEGVKESIISPLRGLGEGLDTVAATVGRFKPSERKLLENILDQDNALKSKAALRGTSVHEVSLGNKVAKVVNTLNTTQEYFFRNIAFQVKLNQTLKAAGIEGGIKGIDPKLIPEKALQDAANYALEMTFASMPKSQFGKEFVKSMSNPIFTALLNPFPRFLFGNALPFLKEFSPLGFLDALNPKVVADLVSGNPDKFAKAASRATIGTLMLNTANYIRNSDMAGEKWYEIKAGNKSWDTRAFAPLTTYLFIAEAMKSPENIKPADVASAMLSLNRVAGTGLVISDVLRGKTMESVLHPIRKIAGEWGGSFTTPIRTVKDIYSAIDPQEAVIRDIRESEFLGPTQRNIPKLSQKLPEAVSPFKTEPLKTESPVLRQVTGLSYKIKNEVETEMDAIGIDKSIAYPRTGIPQADRGIVKYMAPIVESVSEKLLTAPKYQNLDNQTKRVVWWSLFKEIKKEASVRFKQENPMVGAKMQIEGTPSIIQDLLKSKGINLKSLVDLNAPMPAVPQPKPRATLVPNQKR